jgi:F-type H+-transporting ATPase subunit a
MIPCRLPRRLAGAKQGIAVNTPKGRIRKAGAGAWRAGTRVRRFAAVFALLLLTAPLALRAQEGHVAPPATSETFSFSEAIFGELTDNTDAPFAILGTFRIGEREYQLKLTKHLVLLALVSVLVLATMFYLAAKLRHPFKKPTRMQGLFETLLEYMRREVYEPVLGEDGKRFIMLCFTLFLFVLYSNVIGLIPPFLPLRTVHAETAALTGGEIARVWVGGSITGNLAVTAGLGLITFVVLNVAGMRTKGVVGYWKGLVPHGLPKWMVPITWLLEVIGLFSKTLALIMRLFANMIGGHIAILVILLLIIKFQSLAIAPVAMVVDVAISALEIFVAVLQAYIFSFLSALFIGLAIHKH